jgi:hypothetical protein
MKRFYQFEFNGQIVAQDTYGHGRDDDRAEGTYLGELAEIAGRYCGGRTGNILEWGSGISSLMLSDFLAERQRGYLLTIDHNQPYLRAVVSAASASEVVTALAIDTVGPRESESDLCLSYSTVPLHYPDTFDLISIDGRRRMECALTAALISHEETVVIIHDYRRWRYQSVLGLFDVVTDGEQFRVLRLKPGMRAILLEQRARIAPMAAGSQLLTRSFTGRDWVAVVNVASGCDLRLAPVGAE